MIMLRWLPRAWLVCLVAVVVGGVLRGENLAFTLLGVLFVLSAALVATPAGLFVIEPAQGSRRSAIGSGIANLFAGVWIWTLPGRPLLFTGAAIVLAAVGALVIGRTLTGAAPAPATPGAPLRHHSATLLGVFTIFLLVIAYAKTFEGHPRWGHPSAATMTGDLKNLVAVQDLFFSRHNRYGSLADLPAFEPALSRATITVAVDSARFIATATSSETRTICLVWSGTPQPPADSVHGTADGVPVCWEG